MICVECAKFPVQPVTCIPCGHSFCKKCHYSYPDNINDNGKPVCRKCGPNVIITYVYRNEFIEDLIKMF